MTVYTIGHSNRAIEEFLKLLTAHSIEEVADVRTIPKSRHNPQFGDTALKKSLEEQGIGYRHIKELGGLRHAKADSPNTGWRNKSFRGYADYMGTEEFAEGLEQLKKLAKEKRTAIMCAEAVPWRCHRSLIGDALAVEGWEVLDIMTEAAAKPHRMTPFLKVRRGKLTYPAGD